MARDARLLTLAPRIESKSGSSTPEIRGDLHKKAQRKNQEQDDYPTEKSFLKPSQEHPHRLLIQAAWSEREND
jgi:hypothetical protein